MAKTTRLSPKFEVAQPTPTLVDLSKRAVGIVLTAEVNSGHMNPTLAKNLLAAMDRVYTSLVEAAFPSENKEKTS